MIYHIYKACRKKVCVSVYEEFLMWDDKKLLNSKKQWL